MGTHLRRFGALYLLIFLFAASWVGQFLAQVAEIRANAKTHGDPTSGPQFWSDFWPQFWSATLENWQSEFLQLTVQVTAVGLLASFMFRAYQESQISDMKDAVREVMKEREQ